MRTRTPCIRRRHALGAIAGALGAASLSWPARAGAHPSRSHWNPGGIDGVTRTRVGVLSTTTMFNVPSILLPRAGPTYMMPHSAAALASGRFWQESTDCTVREDCQIVINTPGLWVVTTCTDWPGQHDTDVNNRKMTIWRVPIGASPPIYTPGKLSPVLDSDDYDRLASQDMPGSNVPENTRASVPWSPGTIAPHQAVSIEVMLSGTAVVIQPGDFVDASLDSLTDQLLGAAASASLTLRNRVVGTNVVLVQLVNEFGTQPIQVPPGNLKVMAGTATTHAGHSDDAWTTLSTSSEELLAGESIFVSWRSDTPGDYVQTTNMTYVQLELVKRL